MPEWLNGAVSKTVEGVSLSESSNLSLSAKTINNDQLSMVKTMKISEKENPVFEKAYKFAIRIINCYKFLSEKKKETILSKQLLKSGTSIGANVTEAQGAFSKADFSSKISIAYKEALETKYWLNLLKDTHYIDDKSFESIIGEADEICKLLYAILIKSRKKDN